MNPFRRLARADAWSRLGLASEFPDLSLNDDSQVLPACKAFNVPKTSGSTPVEADVNLPGELKDQVLVFQYKGKFHAIDHVCSRSFFFVMFKLTNAAMSALCLSTFPRKSF